MPKRRFLATLGWTLVVLAVLGFGTVADDWRHAGELAGVAAVLASGLAFLGAAYGVGSQAVALEWVPAGIGVGLVIGFATDRMPLAVAFGLGAGLLIGYARRAGKN